MKQNTGNLDSKIHFRHHMPYSDYIKKKTKYGHFFNLQLNKSCYLEDKNVVSFYIIADNAFVFLC